MARMYEIPGAFDSATKRGKDGRYTVAIRDFIHELTRVNHHFSPSQANAWIAQYMPGWRLMDESESGFNVYFRFNPN